MFTPAMLDILIKRYADGSQRKFAEMIELNNPQSITDWKKRGINSLDNIEKIYRRFGDELSAEWLITGEGEPFKQNASISKDAAQPDKDCVLVTQLSEKDKQIEQLHQIIINLSTK